MEIFLISCENGRKIIFLCFLAKLIQGDIWCIKVSNYKNVYKKEDHRDVLRYYVKIVSFSNVDPLVNAKVLAMVK